MSPAGDPARVEDLLRRLAPQVLGVLARREPRFDLCEDAVQEALLAASVRWPDDGIPDNPHGWLVTAAANRLTDGYRADRARRAREGVAAAQEPAAADDPPAAPAGDDTLTLLFLCCHPALTPPSQLALALRAVGGLRTAEIASAFLVPEATIAQRISRAKQHIRADGIAFRPPAADEWPLRLRVVLHALYLMFTEGHTTSAGPELHRVDLIAQAIRLTRLAHRLMPDEDEVAGLLALMLLTDARRAARTTADGALVPLDEQDRTRWDADTIAEGIALVERTLPTGPVGPYQLQAAIAAVHAEARHADQTDWLQILALYDVLARAEPNPMVSLNRAVAVAMAVGPDAGLAAVEAIPEADRAACRHRLDAVRAHMLELRGDRDAALDAYRAAARAATSVPERRHLERRAARLGAR